MSRSRVDEMTSSNLLQKSQPLKLARIDDGHGHRRDVDVPMDAENIFVTVLMHRIFTYLGCFTVRLTCFTGLYYAKQS